MSEATTSRHFQRVKYDVAATLKTAGGAFECKLLDLSLKGALLQLAEVDVFTVGDQGTLSFSLGDEEHIISMETEVAHIESKTIGVHCLQIDLDSVTHLRRILELYTGDGQIMQRELAAMLAQQ